MPFDSRTPSVLWTIARGCAESLINAPRLAHATWSGQSVNLWIGDSHSLFFNQTATSAKLSRAANGHYVWHLGPRLMWSLGTRGFPAGICLAARLLHRLGRESGQVIPIISAGEIDVRCHLATRLPAARSDLSFAAKYVAVGRELASAMGSESVIFVLPVPPGADGAVHKKFPIVGSLSERLTAFQDLAASLTRAVEEAVGSPRAYLLDATDILVDRGGQLDRRFTNDGCHVNREGALLVHGRLTELVNRMGRGDGAIRAD